MVRSATPSPGPAARVARGARGVRTALGALGAALAACSVVAPPPVVPVHAPAQPNPEGTLVVSLVGGLAGGVFIDDGFGLEVRAGYQLTDRLELGGGVGVGRAKDTRTARARKADQNYRECERRKAARVGEPAFVLFDVECKREVADAPDWMTAIRGFGRYTPQLDHPWYAASFGVGAGLADNGLRYLTLQAGVRFSSGDGTADVYLQPTLALSIPIARGRPIHDGGTPRTTFFYGGAIGLLGFAEGDFGGSFDLTFLHGDSSAESAFLMFATGAAIYRDRR